MSPLSKPKAPLTVAMRSLLLIYFSCDGGYYIRNYDWEGMECKYCEAGHACYGGMKTACGVNGSATFAFGGSAECSDCYAGRLPILLRYYTSPFHAHLPARLGVPRWNCIPLPR